MELSTSLRYPCSPSPLFFRPSLILSKRRCITPAVFAARRSRDGRNNSGGRLVDMNMIVLRKRIHEMKMVERNYQPPSHWSEWEKHYFSNYDSIVCDLVGFLQSELMNTRPSVALGIIASVAFSVPVSTAMLFSHFLEMPKLLSNIYGIHFH